MPIPDFGVHGRAVLLTSIGVIAGCATPPPRFNPPAGAYHCPLEVTIVDARADAAIHYAIEGNHATLSSTHYLGPIQVNGTTTPLAAVAVPPNASASRVATATFICTNPTLNRIQFARALQQQFNLTPPASRVPYSDVAPDDAADLAAQAIAPFQHRKLLCQGCRLTLAFAPIAQLTRNEAAIVLGSILVQRGKIALLNDAETGQILASVVDLDSVPVNARRLVASALANGVVMLRSGNQFQGSAPYAPEELTADLGTIRRKFTVPSTPLE